MLLIIFSCDDSYDFNDFLYTLGITEPVNFLLEDMASTKTSLGHFANAVPTPAATDNSDT